MMLYEGRDHTPKADDKVLGGNENTTDAVCYHKVFLL